MPPRSRNPFNDLPNEPSGLNPFATLPDEPLEPIRADPLETATGGLVSRGGFTTAGGLVGGLLGAGGAAAVTAGTGSIPGGLAGGALGAAGGSLAFDNVQDALIYLGALDAPHPTMKERLTTAGKEGVLDLGFAGVGTLVRPILGARALLGKISRVTAPQAKQLKALGDSFGVSLGAVDVGGGVPKGVAKMLGVFPFTGTPFRKGMLQKQREASLAADRILNDLAPNATTMSELGLDMEKAARGTTDNFKKISGILYDNFRDIAQSLTKTEIIPTNSSADAATKLLADLDSGRLLLKSGKEMVPPKQLETGFREYLEQYAELPETININQFRRLTSEFEGLLRSVQTEAVDVRSSTLMKQALEIDLNNIRTDLLPADEAKLLRSALDAANNFFSKGLLAFQARGIRPLTSVQRSEIETLRQEIPSGFRGMRSFETPSAQKFTRVDKRIFGPGAVTPGTLEPDEIARIAVNLRSSKAIDSLEELVGRKNIRKAARQHVENAINQSTEELEIGIEQVSAINPVQFLKRLGIKGGDKGQRQALAALLRRGGIKLSDLENLAEVIGKIEGIGDPATFLKRRLILGGAGAITGAGGFGVAAGLGAGASGGAVSALIPIVFLTAGARKLSSIFSNRTALLNMITAMNEAKALAPRRAATARVLKFLAQQDASIKRQQELRRRQAISKRGTRSRGSFIKPSPQ